MHKHLITDTYTPKHLVASFPKDNGEPKKKGIKFQTSKVGGLENKAPKARKARESWTKGKKRSDIDEWDEGKTGNTAAKCESHSTKKEKRRQENQTKLKKGKEGKEDRGTGLRTEIITGEKIMIMS